MNRLTRLIGIATLLIFVENLALANDTLRDANSKAFLLRGPTRTTPVVSLRDAIKQKSEFMRMPDLGTDGTKGQSGVEGDVTVVERVGKSGHDEKEVDVFNDRLERQKSKGRSKSTLRELANTAESHKAPTALRFGTVKISGTLRLPRVKFARVGVAMDLRDEMPSLDFTQKSLKDSGF